MTPQPLPDDLNDAAWLPQALDPRAGLVRLVSMDAAEYRAASFLDDRMLRPDLVSRLCALDALVTQGATLPVRSMGWIFHIGHVGSTLISRLLGELPDALAIREPRSLRDAAIAGIGDDTLAALRNLLSRPLGSQTKAIVKATSFVSDLAPRLHRPGDRSLLLYASPLNYIAGILAGPNSRQELAAMRDFRSARLTARGVQLSELDGTDAHRAAHAWVCEMAALDAAATAMGDEGLWMDFDAMLSDVVGELRTLVDHFDLNANDDALRSLADGPLMGRYSKALEHDYSPNLRADLRREAIDDHQGDIDAALAALDRAAEGQAWLRRALDRAAGERVNVS